jgi:hypothetical protein
MIRRVDSSSPLPKPHIDMNFPKQPTVRVGKVAKRALDNASFKKTDADVTKDIPNTKEGEAAAEATKEVAGEFFAAANKRART